MERMKPIRISGEPRTVRAAGAEGRKVIIMIEAEMFIPFLLIVLGVIADQLTTLYHLKRKTAHVGIEKALEDESNKHARKDYKKHGLKFFSMAFYKELVLGLLVGVIVFIWSGNIWTVSFISAAFWGMPVNNLISTYFNETIGKSLLLHFIIKVGTALAIAVILFVIFKITWVFGMPFEIALAMMYFKYITKTF